jgi:hypothetical protein
MENCFMYQILWKLYMEYYTLAILDIFANYARSMYLFVPLNFLEYFSRIVFLQIDQNHKSGYH